MHQATTPPKKRKIYRGEHPKRISAKRNKEENKEEGKIHITPNTQHFI
jgi:hypothetical protein